MPQPHLPISTQEDSDLTRALNLFTRNYKLLAACVLVALAIAFLFNRYAVPVYRTAGSLLILEKNSSGIGVGDPNGYINSELFGNNQGFQNELYVLQSTPVIEQTVKNLDLIINYFQKDKFRYLDTYKASPFRILLLKDHVQPVNVRFTISIRERIHAL